MDEKPPAAGFSRSKAKSGARSKTSSPQGREDSLKQPKIHVIADKFAQRAAKMVFFAGLGVAPGKKRFRARTRDN
jgi:hypothetical protein